jgi:Fe-S cluster assembly protein SufD
MIKMSSIINNAKTEPDFFNSWKNIRSDALKNFKNKGFPSKNNESWKYTSLLGLSEDLLEPAHKSEQHIQAKKPINNSFFIKMVNGHIDLENSVLPEELRVIDLEVGHKDESSELVMKSLFENTDKDNFQTHIDINTAYCNKILVAHIPKGKCLEKPIEIHYIHEPENEYKSSYTQLWILQEDDSHVTLIERFYGDASKEEKCTSHIHNHVARIQLNKSACLTHYRIQESPNDNYNIYTAHLEMKDESNYNSFTFCKGAILSRNEVKVNINGTKAHCNQQGVTLGQYKQHHDSYLPVSHNSPDSYSNQNFRQLLDGNSKGVFYSNVFVPKDSIKTEAHQLNHNLLISDMAQAFTRPELDIFTDEVVCSHGATVGNLDDNSLYYLQTRGLNEDQSKALMIESFANELIDDLKNEEIKDLIKLSLMEWIYPKCFKN